MFVSLIQHYRTVLRRMRIRRLKETNRKMRELDRHMNERRAAVAAEPGTALRKASLHMIIGDWHWHNLEPLLKERLRLADLLGVPDKVAARLR